MAEDILVLKKVLRNTWKILKDDDQSKFDRNVAGKQIIELQKKIKELEPTFPDVDLATTKYAELLGLEVPKATVIKSVYWPTKITLIESSDMLKSRYNEIVAIAVGIVKDRHPAMGDDSNTFGQIVNATVANLIALGKLK